MNGSTTVLSLLPTSGSRASVVRRGVGGCLGFFLLASGPLHAQAVPNLALEWRWVDFGPESGLPPGRPVELVEQDTLVWLRTELGVAWYDGFQWRPALLGESPPEGTPTSLAPDSAGGVLLVQGNRLYRGGSGGLEELRIDGLPPGAELTTALPVEEGGLLLVTADATERAAWIVREGSARRVEGLPALTGTPSAWLTKADHVWLATVEGFYDRRGGRWVPRERLAPAERTGSLVVEGRDGTGFAYRGGGEGTRGVVTFSRNGPLVREAEEGDNVVVSADVGSEGLIVAAYETGDVRVRERGVWRTLELPQSRRAGVHLVHLSESGNLWFGTTSGLHLYIRRSRWTAIRRPFPAQSNRVNAILVEGDSILWLGTGGGVLRHVFPRGGRAPDSRWYTSADGKPLNAITGLAQDDDGSVWFVSGSSFAGAYRWREGRLEHVGAAQGLDIGSAHRVFAGADGRLWFASLGAPDGTGAGLYSWRDGSLDAVFDQVGHPDARTYGFAQGPQGVLWAATILGLVRIEGDRFEEWRFTGVNREEPPRAWDVTLAPDGTPWVALDPVAAAGLVHILPDGTVEHVVPPGPLAARRVWSVAFDEAGVLWAGSEAGLLRYDGVAWSRFDESVGLDAVTVWPIAFNAGALLAGTKGGGMISLNTSESSNPPPRVVVRSSTQDQGNLHLTYSALPYWGEMPADAVETRTRVDGGGWGAWSTTREVNLSGLKAGRHTVELQAKGLYGQRSDPVLATVVVPLPLALRPVFALPVGFLLSALMVLGWVASARRQRDAEALRVSEGRLRALVETAPGAIGILDVDTQRFVDANEHALRLFGIERSDLATAGPREFVVDSGDGTLDDMIARALEGDTPVAEREVVDRQGRRIPCEIRVARLSEDRRLLRMSLDDIRARIAARQAHEELEIQLRQSQKLEAVGQLTGGVAHDFNNLLTVIRGNLEMMGETTHLDEQGASLLNEALHAAERSAGLTQRLLAFSRRQTLAPRRVHLQQVVQGMHALLSRSLGETSAVLLDVAEDTWPVNVDPGQLESALLNLVLNSGDAMPRGGRVVIKTVNVVLEPDDPSPPPDLAPGEYVRLSVRDTGPGMPEDVQARAFDPFFTTKEVGKGTGLGLSMVYGFVSQSGGTVTLESPPEQGLTVHLYLPRD